MYYCLAALIFHAFHICVMTSKLLSKLVLDFLGIPAEIIKLLLYMIYFEDCSRL